MPRNTTLLCLLTLAFLTVLAGGAMAQDTTLIANTTNACIDNTFKSYSPSSANPTAILIDRRLNVDPGPCTTADSNAASCSIDVGQDYLVAAVSGTANIGNSPSCSWNCAPAGCGTIVTDGTIGLPVELMDFGFEDEEPAADSGGEAAGDR